jgi:hypothetical protein
MVRSSTISSLFRLPLCPVFVICVSSVPGSCPETFWDLTVSPSALATSHSPLATAAVSPFLATLTSHLQLTENTATLSPAFATLADRVRHNSFVCHSYKKHPGWGSHRSSQIFFFRNLTTRLSPLSAMSFVIRTYGKSASNSCRIRTSKTQDLKPFRMNTSEKPPPGGTSLQPKSFGFHRGVRCEPTEFRVSIFEFRPSILMEQIPCSRVFTGAR